MDSILFFPFYERWASNVPGARLGRVFVSCGLAGIFLLSHAITLGWAMFADWSWFLGALIVTATLSLYTATLVFRNLLLMMQRQLGPESFTQHIGRKMRLLADKYFLASGGLVGLMNCLMGYNFGLPYEIASANASIVLGYLISGPWFAVSRYGGSLLYVGSPAPIVIMPRSLLI